jgi:shikimate 5-dehydrogenase
MAHDIQDEVEAKQYYLLGYNIKDSFSPLLHNTGFKILGLPHQYGLFEVPDVDDSVEKLLADPKVGGLSVTAPHKLQVGRYMNEISEEARTMGSVNTIVASITPGSNERRLFGDNTDWLGITRCIQGGNVNITAEGTAAVVSGAGGAARAAVFALINWESARSLLLIGLVIERKGWQKAFQSMILRLFNLFMILNKG